MTAFSSSSAAAAGLILLEQHQREIKVDVETRSVERRRALQGGQRRRGLSSFEVGESEPMLQLGVARPARDGLLSDSRSFAQTA